VCSALKTAEFVGGSRTLESIEANELTGIYPELDPLIRDLPVERFPARVAVAWDEDMPPRSATWTPRDGCQIMPVGWTGEQVALRTIPPRRDPGFVRRQPPRNGTYLPVSVALCRPNCGGRAGCRLGRAERDLRFATYQHADTCRRSADSADNALDRAEGGP